MTSSVRTVRLRQLAKTLRQPDALGATGRNDQFGRRLTCTAESSV
jgi:hypothetical protein